MAFNWTTVFFLLFNNQLLVQMEEFPQWFSFLNQVNFSGRFCSQDFFLSSSIQFSPKFVIICFCKSINIKFIMWWFVLLHRHNLWLELTCGKGGEDEPDGEVVSQPNKHKWVVNIWPVAWWKKSKRLRIRTFFQLTRTPDGENWLERHKSASECDSPYIGILVFSFSFFIHFIWERSVEESEQEVE